MADVEGARVWVCPGCGEKLEPQFDSCWSCGSRRDREQPLVEAPRPRRACAVCREALHLRGRMPVDLEPHDEFLALEVWTCPRCGRATLYEPREE